MKLKKDALSTIEIFMIDYENNAYISPKKAISGRLYPRNVLEQKLRFIYAAWAAAAVYTNNPTISLDAASRLFGMGDSLYKPLTRGTDFDGNTLKKILLKLNKLAAEESANTVPIMAEIPIPLSWKLDVYKNALEELSIYKEIAGIYFVKPEARSFYNREHWFEEATKAYHITMLMKEFLGIDWMFFAHLDDNIFIEASFRRHHFRDDLNRKRSLYVSDLFLTDASMMNMWEKLTEAESLIIMEAGQKLISIEKDITIRDIDEMFGENEWLYENIIKEFWYKDMTQFRESLAEFNLKKRKFKELGIEGWMEEFYDVAYKRFFDQYGQGVYSLLVRVPGLADYSDYINVDFGKIFREYGGS